MATSATTPIASNRRARHDYAVLDVVEAGLVLHGSEVKSLRLGQVQLAEAFARVSDGELWLEGVHIAPYQFASGVGAHDPDRRRKLLLHRDEIDRLQARVAQAPDPSWHYAIVSLHHDDAPSLRSYRIVDGTVAEEDVLVGSV